MAAENRICIVFDDFSKKSKNLSKNEENYCGPTCVVYNPFLFLIPEFQRKSGIVGKYYTTTYPVPPLFHTTVVFTKVLSVRDSKKINLQFHGSQK